MPEFLVAHKGDISCQMFITERSRSTYTTTVDEQQDLSRYIAILSAWSIL